jgi:hypothetical protein
MREPTAAASSIGPARRVAVAVGLAVVLLAPLVFVFAQFWAAKSGELEFNRDERRGVRYLGPMTELVSVVTEQQSAMIRGQPVDGVRVQRAITGVDEADEEVGAQLRTTELWALLRQRVLDVTANDFADRAEAYTAYSEVVDLGMTLVRKVGDTSNLILDPILDAYYVMNATLLRIPELIVDSGRYADLAYITTRSDAPGSVATTAQLVTARNRVATAAEDLGAGLEKAFNDTSSETLGPGLLRPLDDFRTAVDDLAPTTSLLAPMPSRLQASAVADQQDGVQRATMTLDAVALRELDQLLADRVAAIRLAQLTVLAALIVGVVVAAAIVVLAAPVRRPAGPAARRAPRTRHGRIEQPGQPAQPAARPAQPAARPAAFGAQPGQADEPARVGEVLAADRAAAFRQGGARAAR